MPVKVPDLLDRLCDEISARIDRESIARARKRQADMMAGRVSDYIPIVHAKPVELPSLNGDGDWPEFDWAEQWHDPAKSLYMQLKDTILPATGCGNDIVPGVRADTGVINCMTVFGAQYVVPEHTKPVINEYVPKDRIVEFEVPADISREGIMPQMAEHMRHHRSVLESHGLWGAVDLWHCDQQGPFDIAAQVRGHDVFLDLHEDPEFVHLLMDKCTRVYVAVSKLCKSLNSEPLTSGNAVGFYLENGGVRMCGDSDILVSAAQHREFIAPYQQKAFAEFGGGWLHYCGGWKGTGRSEGLHLHEVYADIDGLRGLNWTTAKDWLGEMKKLAGLGVTHVGTLPREENQGLRDYFRMALEPYDDRTGMIFQFQDIRDGEHEIAQRIWHEIQDEKYS